jgi:hypothetical protein
LYGLKRGLSYYAKNARRTVFENMVLRKIYGSKKVKVKEDWRKLHEE